MLNNQKFKATGIVCATALTLCLYAPRVEAFGGLGILGHKSSHKGGVNAIGVHIDTENKEQPNIDIRSCDSETEELVGSECCLKTFIYTDNDTTKCCSTEGYAVQDGKCKKQCGEGFVLNEETNECEDACPAERKCGDICCGLYNICVDGNKCCHADRALSEEELAERCCDINESIGFSSHDNFYRCCDKNSNFISVDENAMVAVCCSKNSPGFADWDGRCCEEDESIVKGNETERCCPTGSIGLDIENNCCEAGNVLIGDDEKHCCPSGSTGFTNNDGCCEAGTIAIQDENEEKHCCPTNSTGFDTDNWECI